MPEVFKQLDGVRRTLETHYRDMQDIESPVQRGKFYMLQTRNGKRTAKAALKIAVDMVRDGLIDKKEAVARIVPSSLDQLLHPTLDPKAQRKVIAKGLTRHRRARHRARSCSRPTRRKAGPRRREGDPGAPRDQPRRTSTACTPPRAF